MAGTRTTGSPHYRSLARTCLSMPVQQYRPPRIASVGERASNVDG